MSEGEALRLATGYAWGHQDGSGVTTIAPYTTTDGPVRFAMAYAALQVAYNEARADYMPSVRTAYRVWQESNGTRVADPR